MSEVGGEPSGGGKPKTRSVIAYKAGYFPNLSLMMGWMKLYESENRQFKRFNQLNVIVNLVTSDKQGRIKVNNDLIKEFREWHNGSTPDKRPSFRDLKPFDRQPTKGFFAIGRPVPMKEAWAGYSAEYVAFQAGYSIPITNPDGSIERKPIEFTGDEVTNNVIISWWSTRFQFLLRILEPLASQIEVEIASGLEEHGIEVALQGPEQLEEMEMEGGEEAGQ